jgi:hypothetical protein
MNNYIDAPDLLFKLSLVVPSFYLRYPQIFKTKFYASNYGYPVLFKCACCTLNDLSNMDIIYDYLPSIIKKLY